MKRRSFIGGVCSVFISGFDFKSKCMLWKITYDYARRGTVLLAYVQTNLTNQVYCACLLRDVERGWYGPEELWTIYGCPAALAITRELNMPDSFADEQKANFIARITDGRA